MDYKTIMMDEIAIVEDLPSRIYNICISDDIRTLFDPRSDEAVPRPNLS